MMMNTSYKNCKNVNKRLKSNLVRNDQLWNHILWIKLVPTFLGFCVLTSHSGNVDKHMAGMAYLAQFFDSSEDFLITCNEACSFCSM